VSLTLFVVTSVGWIVERASAESVSDDRMTLARREPESDVRALREPLSLARSSEYREEG
jgi:hypothetical protein